MRRSDFDDLERAGVLILGDVGFRGDCPTEEQEQVTFFARVRSVFPDTLGRLAIHPRNEGLKRAGHIRSVSKHKAEGMTPGAADIIIPARIPFVCELKRRDHTKSQWQEGQREYLIAAADVGAWSCVALGCDVAWQSLLDWHRNA